MIYYATMPVPDAPSSEHYLNLKARLDVNSTVILAGGGSCPSTKAGGVYESYTIASNQGECLTRIHFIESSKIYPTLLYRVASEYQSHGKDHRVLAQM